MPLSFTHSKRENLDASYLLTKQNAIKVASSFIASIRMPKKHYTDKHSNTKKHESTEPENSICCHNNAPGSVAMNNGIHHVTSSVIYTNEQRFCGMLYCQRFLGGVPIVRTRDGYHALRFQFMRAQAAVNDIDDY